MTKRYPLLLVICPAMLFAQTTPNSVTVTATRNSNVQPDQVVYLVNVDTPLEATRDAAVSALQGSGVTAADFYGVRTTQSYNNDTQAFSNSLQWSFTLVSTIANMKSAAGLLSAVQKTIAGSGKGFTMSFGLQGARVSQQAQQAQPCSLQDLVADARAQAQRLASGTGASVGAVMAIIGAPLVADSGASPFSQFISAPPCALTVRFQLTGGF